MVYPDFKQFKKLAKKGNLIPVYKKIPADLETPVSAFLKVARECPSSFLLESVELGENIGRYSFIGSNPNLVIEAKNGRVAITKNRKLLKRVKKGDDLLDHIKEMFHGYRFVGIPDLPAFCGGFVGYISYESVEDFEDISLRKKKSLGFPESVFFLAEDILVFDHVERSITIVSLCEIKGSLSRAYKESVKKIDSTIKGLSKKLSIKKRKKPSRKSVAKINSNVKRSVFERNVKKIKSYIRAGECIQVVLSQRFGLGDTNDDFQVYRALRSINPSPYMFYFKHSDLRLIGSSPEMLVKKMGHTAEIKPIAGTRKRGSTEEEDQKMEKELVSSKKELAEHLMLVDLARNDIGRVCKYNTVEVKDYARVERYSHVMHLVSDVVGRLKEGKDCFDLLEATFPAGTVTGAPKIRAMQIIDELEQETRGPYAGCVGYFSFNGDMDMCIAIRTIVVKNKQAYVQAGAGIVNDSVPHKEYLETVNKAKALFRAIELAHEIEDSMV